MQMYNIQFRRIAQSYKILGFLSFQKNIGYSFNQPFHLIGHVESIYSKRDIIAYIGTVQLFLFDTVGYHVVCLLDCLFYDGYIITEINRQNYTDG